MRILAEAIAGLPLHIYRYRADGGKERIPLHPLYHLLHDEPNPEMTSFVFRKTLMSHLLLWGNAFAQVVRNGRGQAVELGFADKILFTEDEARVPPDTGESLMFSRAAVFLGAVFN